jgi:hypothetical protein
MEGVNYIDEEPRWQAFDAAHNAHLPDSSLMGARLDYTFGTVLHSPQTAAKCRLEPYDTLTQDCILTPVSSEADLDIPLSDSASLPWSVSYPHDLEPLSISVESCTQEAAKGTRKEVCRSFSLNPSCHTEAPMSDNDAETSRSKQESTEGFQGAQRQGHPKTGK